MEKQEIIKNWIMNIADNDDMWIPSSLEEELEEE